MSYARILVNGDGLLENWATLAPEQPRHSPEAREELIERLTQFYDVHGTPLTVVFDDLDPYEDDDETGVPGTEPPEIQVLFTQKRNRPEHTIQRMVRQLKSLGDILVVGPESIQPQTPSSTSAYQDFIREVEETLSELERKLNQLHGNVSTEFKRNPQ